jgi:hypothetical protein
VSSVAILGSGPAGLLAALAVEHNGQTPVIFSKGEKSEMFGAMYLHRAIPGLHQNPLSPDFEIDIIKAGSKEGYAEKVYGDPSAPASWDHFTAGYTPAWDLHAAYDRLWERYVGNIRHVDLNVGISGIICHNYPFVFSTIPAPVLCERRHEFKKQDIWVVHGPWPHEDQEADNMMYYNGIPEDEWYRFSQINRYQAWEYSHRPQWEWEDEEGISGWQRHLSEGVKPLENNCTCWEKTPNFYRLGRFGKWQKGVLTHHAYEDTMEVLRNALH